MSQTKINGIGGRKAATTENLPAVKTDSFALTGVGDTTLNLPAEFAGEVDKTDFEGYETSRDILPIVSIRQKEVKDEKTGKVLIPAGNFRIHDSISKTNGVAIPDVDGESGLLVTVLARQTSRTFWAEGNFDQPNCKSIDGITGVGEPGGRCDVCNLAQWRGKSRPECGQSYNLLVYDHALQSCYVFRVGRSGLLIWDGLQSALTKRKSPVPIHSIKVRVTTQFNRLPAPFYTPVFHVEEGPDVDLFRSMKSLRVEHSTKLVRTVEVDTPDDEAHNAASRPVGNDPGGELPPGTKRVVSDEGLPF